MTPRHPGSQPGSCTTQPSGNASPTQAWNERSLAGLAAKARTLRHRPLRQPVPRAPKPLPSARLGRAYLMPVRTGLHLLIRFSYRERGARASVQLPVSNTTGTLPALSSANPGRADRTAPTSRPEGDLEASCDARRPDGRSGAPLRPGSPSRRRTRDRWHCRCISPENLWDTTGTHRFNLGNKKPA